MGLGKISKKRRVISTICIGAMCSVGLVYMDNYNIIEGFAENKDYIPTSLVKPYSSTSSQVKSNTTSKEEVEYSSDIDGWNVCNENSNYNLSENESGQVSLTFNNTKNNEFITKDLPLTYVDGDLINSINIKFTNKNNSVSNIIFYLQGDEKMLVSSGDEQHMEYYCEKIGEYRLEDLNASNEVSMTLDIESALKNLEGHLTKGARIAMYIESDNAYINSYDRIGEIVFQSVEGISVKFGENAFTPWQVNGGYTLKNGIVTYDGIGDFENVSSYIKNYNYKCRYLNLEIRNIDKSAENLVINLYGKNNEVANINVDLSKYSKSNIKLQYDILELNNNLGNVDKIELLIDSNPYVTYDNKVGSIEILSAYFSATKK